MTLLLAEDEEDIRQMLIDLLSEEGYEVLGAKDGLEAYELFQNESPDIGIFDSMMPNMDGITLMKKIRAESNMPIIFLTARGQELDKVRALTLGADDYIVKPFSIAELKARIGVQIRKLQQLKEGNNKQTLLKCGEITIDQLAATAYLRGEILNLSAKEYQYCL